jgi:hypothetical protein
VGRGLVDARADLVVQGPYIVVVEGQEAADQRVEDDPAAPDVDLGPAVRTPRHLQNMVLPT